MNAGKTEAKAKLAEIRKKAVAEKLQRVWRKYKKAKSGEEKKDDGEPKDEGNNDEINVEDLGQENIKKQTAVCLKVIETAILALEPKTFKQIPEDIEREPETKEGADMRTCFKRLLSGYCKRNGLESTVKTDEKARDVLHTGKGFDMSNLPTGAKSLLKDKRGGVPKGTFW